MRETNGVLWDKYGPRLEMVRAKKDGDYSHVLHISDLNPQLEVKWAFSRWTMVRIGLWFIRRAIFARSTTPPGAEAP